MHRISPGSGYARSKILSRPFPPRGAGSGERLGLPHLARKDAKAAKNSMAESAISGGHRLIPAVPGSGGWNVREGVGGRDGGVL